MLQIRPHAEQLSFRSPPIPSLFLCDFQLRLIIEAAASFLSVASYMHGMCLVIPKHLSLGLVILEDDSLSLKVCLNFLCFNFPVLYSK